MQSKQIVPPDRGLFENISSFVFPHLGHFPSVKIIASSLLSMLF